MKSKKSGFSNFKNRALGSEQTKDIKGGDPSGGGGGGLLHDITIWPTDD